MVASIPRSETVAKSPLVRYGCRHCQRCRHSNDGKILVVGGSNRGSQNDFAWPGITLMALSTRPLAPTASVAGQCGDDYATAVTLFSNFPLSSVHRTPLAATVSSTTLMEPMALSPSGTYSISTQHRMTWPAMWVIDPFGKVIIGGTTTISGVVDRMSLAAVTLDGQPITSYGPFSTGFAIDFLSGDNTGLRGLGDRSEWMRHGPSATKTLAQIIGFALAAFGDQGNQLFFKVKILDQVMTRHWALLFVAMVHHRRWLQHRIGRQQELRVDRFRREQRDVRPRLE